MRNALLTALLMLAPAALAQPAPGNMPDEGPGGDTNVAPFEAKHLQHLAQELGLSPAQAQQMQAQTQAFHQQQKGLHQQVKANMDILRASASGDATAAGQTDAAIARLRDLHLQMMKAHQQLFDTVSQGLTAQQKAKLVLAFVHRMHEGGGHGHHGWQHEPGPAQQP